MFWYSITTVRKNKCSSCSHRIIDLLLDVPNFKSRKGPSRSWVRKLELTFKLGNPVGNAHSPKSVDKLSRA